MVGHLLGVHLLRWWPLLLAVHDRLSLGVVRLLFGVRLVRDGGQPGELSAELRQRVLDL
jgi:hypothetical protein